MSSQQNWYPQLVSGSKEEIQEALRQTLLRVYAAHDSIAKLAQATMEGQSKITEQIQNSAAQTQQTLTTLPGYNLFQAGSSSQVKAKQASMLPVAVSALTYDNSVSGVIAWFFTSLKIMFPDGTTINVPDTTLAHPSISVSGLTPSTTYRFYPFYNMDQQTVQWAMVAGGVGTPAAAYTSANLAAAAAQNADGMVNLAPGGMTATASGGGGGGGTGGGRTI